MSGSQEIETACCSRSDDVGSLFILIRDDIKKKMLCAVRYRERLVIIVCWPALIGFETSILKWEYTSSTHIVQVTSGLPAFVYCVAALHLDYEHITTFQ